MKSNLVVEKPRFRYGNAMKKLKASWPAHHFKERQEMGFDDTSELRDVRTLGFRPDASAKILTKCGGDLSSTLRTINGMRA